MMRSVSSWNRKGRLKGEDTYGLRNIFRRLLWSLSISCHSVDGVRSKGGSAQSACCCGGHGLPAPFFELPVFPSLFEECTLRERQGCVFLFSQSSETTKSGNALHICSNCSSSSLISPVEAFCPFACSASIGRASKLNAPQEIRKQLVRMFSNLGAWSHLPPSCCSPSNPLACENLP